MKSKRELKIDLVNNYLKEIFLTEVNFLEIFGKSINQDKVIKIITEIIPTTYWRENEKLICE